MKFLKWIRKSFTSLFRGIKDILKALCAPLKSRNTNYFLAGSVAAIAWGRYALHNPASIVVEAISLGFLTAVASRFIKVKDKGIGSDLLNAFCGALCFAGAFLLWNFVREASIILSIIAIPFALMDIDRKYIQYCNHYGVTYG